MKKHSLYISIFYLTSLQAVAQHSSDSAKTNMKGYLSEITVVGEGSKRDIQQMPEVVGTDIYAGKKNSLIVLDNVQGNIVTNNMRQVMAKVPGIQIWESDASGIQIGVSARGLSPNRSWEFNVRQNGYDISADPYGYPEAYYNPQLQAVQRIQVVRGAGALQYGPQFGGMLNYILRDGSDIQKPFQFETQQTVGSYGLFNTFNAIGGNTDKVHYYAFFDHRNGDGWRDNSKYKTNTGFATVNYKVSSKLKIGAEVMVYDMLSQQAGGLTDSMFALDAQKSYRSRNWFNTPWVTTALNANWKINNNSQLSVKLSGMWGERNSVGLTGKIDKPDNLDTTLNTIQYAKRDLAKDEYRNFALEARYLNNYRLFGKSSTISVGVRAFKGNTYRLQNGKGTTGTEYDMTLTQPAYGGQYDLATKEYAVFAENIFHITDRLLVVPGVRYENVTTVANGRNGFNADGSEKLINKESRSRSIFLAGIGAEYHLGNTEIYANATQNYRPMLFSDLSAVPTTDTVDANMKDASGYNIDLGYRGMVSNYLFFDVSAFYLQYNDRIGLIGKYRTNVGNSTSKGVEALVEFNPVKALAKMSKVGDIGLFVSYGYTNAVYDEIKGKNQAGNKVENAPEHILRSGISYNLRGFSLTYQFSYVDEAFSGADNLVVPTSDGTSGLIPSYTVSDFTASYRFNKNISIKAGVNNLTDARYFTRRSGGYPGPGLLPADGRTFFVSVGAKF